MLTNTSFQVSTAHDIALSTDEFFAALTSIRKEWESTAEGESLLNCPCSVGLLLFDVVTKLDVPIAVQRQILGFDLHDEVTKFVTGGE